MSIVQTERVLVVPTELFHCVGYFQGFNDDVERYVRELLRPDRTAYRLRGEMEEDPAFQTVDSVRHFSPYGQGRDGSRVSIHSRQRARRTTVAPEDEYRHRRSYFVRGRRLQ